MVSVIIINYNTFALTCNCIRSVIKFTQGVRYEIILVDNASTERNPDTFLEEFPALVLVKSKLNGGFAYGNNLGIEKSKGEYILLLNSDTVLEEDSISKSVGYFVKQNTAGVLGCRMIYPDGRLQYTARKVRSISWELLDLFRVIPWMMPYKKRAAVMMGKYFRHDENIECDWVNGAYFLFLKEIVLQLPGNKLDDRFFMYGEDQLWCEQFKNRGYRVIFFADTTIVHINSGSTHISKQLKLRKIMMKHELEIMKLRKGSGVYYYLFKILYSAKEMARNFIKFIFFKITEKPLR